MLVVEAVSKAFYDPGRGEVRAVDDLSCGAGGGVVALVGANGAGKTTLLRLISGILRPDHGRITVDGHDAALDADAVRSRLGYLSPATRLYQRLSAREMLAYSAGFFGLEGDQLAGRIDEMSAAFDLDAILDQPCGKLSTGQNQRVNLARTLIADPPLLVLDEPTTGLDLVAAEAVVAAVRAARRPGRLILFCTHHTDEVEAVADRLWVLRQGRLVHDGPVADLGTGPDLRTRIFAFVEGREAEVAP